MKSGSESDKSENETNSSAPVPDSPLFAPVKYESRFKWLYFSVMNFPNFSCFVAFFPNWKGPSPQSQISEKKHCSLIMLIVRCQA